MIILSKRISLYYHTLRYLTFRQIYYQVIHRLKITFLKQLPSEVIRSIDIQLLNLLPSIPSGKSYLGDSTFIFLNKRKVFVEKIDWDLVVIDEAADPIKVYLISSGTISHTKNFLIN